MTTPLFNKASAAVTAFLGRDETRPILCSVHITDTHVEATDSYRACRITHMEGPTSLDFPTIGGRKVAESLSDVCIDGRAFKKAVSGIPSRGNSQLPVLQTLAVLEESDHAVSLAATDLTSSTVIITRKVEGSFPDLERLMPTDEPDATILFNPDFFKQMGAAFVQFGSGPVTVEFRGACKPAIFRATNHSGQTMECILMPVRS